MAATLLEHEGDCQTLATALEPLLPSATSIFSRAKKLAAKGTPEETARLGARFEAVKTEFESNDKERAAALDRKTSEIATKCEGNADLRSTFSRLGLRLWAPPK